MGTYAITQGTLALSTNYDLSYIGADFTITQATPTLSVDNSPVVYDGTPQAAVVASSELGTVDNILYDGSATVPTDAGTYAVTATLPPRTRSISSASPTNLPVILSSCSAQSLSPPILRPRSTATLTLSSPTRLPARWLAAMLSPASWHATPERT